MKISVIGTGYVGLVTGTCFAEMGNEVICVDNNQEKLEKMRNAIVPIYEPGLEILFHRNIEKKRLSFTDDLKFAVANSEYVFLCLPTPPGADGSADLQFVMKVADEIGGYLEETDDYKLIINKSTVPVGTSQKVDSILAKHGISNYEVISNPEFLKEGFAVDDFMKPDRVVIGARTEKAFQMMRVLYEPFVRQGNPIIEMDNESSEVTKYAANSYLAMRITFMNQLANFCETAGANIDLIRKGMGSDSRIGKRFLFAGIGYGGSCFPKDVKALINTAKEFSKNMTLLETVDAVNDDQKSVIVNKVKSHFGDIKGMTFAVWGLSFKPNTDDMREAPSTIIINKLISEGAKVNAYDPAAVENAKIIIGDMVDYKDDMYSTLENADALLVFTEWNEFRNPDFDKIKAKLNNNVIFDGRNIFDIEKMKKLGFTYFSIGRQPIK